MYALDLDFTHYDDLVKTLTNSHAIKDVHQKKGTIKQAIIDHFSTTGQEIMLSVFKDHITLKKSFIDETRDEQFDRSLHACTLKLRSIAANPDKFRSADTLWIIPSETRQELYAYYAKSALSDDMIKHELRIRIEQLFGLDENEIVLFLRGRIYIRKSAATPKRHKESDRRFAGKSPEEMQGLYERYFPEGAWSAIEEILPDTLNDRLDFTSINNRRFIKTFVQVFRSMVEIIVLENVEDAGKEDLLAFSGYILRNHFDAILRHTAMGLLELIESRDKNAEAFIKYYNGEVVIDDEGNKTVQHAILDSNGQKWNYSSILSILIQWKEAKNRAKHQDERLRDTLERQKVAESSLKEREPSKQEADKVIDAIKAKVHANREKFKRLKADGRPAAQSHQQYRNELVALRDEDRRLVGSLRRCYEEHDTVLRDYDNLLKEVNNWKRESLSNAQQLKETYTQNKVIKASHNLITKALITVLAKR